MSKRLKLSEHDRSIIVGAFAGHKEIEGIPGLRKTLKVYDALDLDNLPTTGPPDKEKEKVYEVEDAIWEQLKRVFESQKEWRSSGARDILSTFDRIKDGIEVKKKEVEDDKA